jgi:hypothetical protein
MTSLSQRLAQRRTTEAEVSPSAVQATAHLSQDTPRRRRSRVVTMTARA